MIRRGVIVDLFVTLLYYSRGAAAQYDSCTNGTVADIGNGRCDASNNNLSCGFDGGDCCPCTCTDGPLNSCTDSDIDCLFPDCAGDSAATSEESTCVEGWKSDGFCDADENNTPLCDYDGGDCCGSTCVDGAEYACGFNFFACHDPAVFDSALVAEFPDCPDGWFSLGDGMCDLENNNPACGYDLGDCCLCSCSGSACPLGFFECLDPGAADGFYECEAPPPASIPCSTDVQRAWVVETSAQARALAAAVNCSGGSFEAEWRGNVVVDRPIYVMDGTVLTVTGADSTAVIDGNDSTRLFLVVDATLRVSDVMIRSGASILGGAIAAAGSTLTFNRTNFVESRASGHGGAVYVSDGSSVSCSGGSFADNRAGSDGGAMYVTGRSVVSCGGLWLNNSAGDSAGAVMARDFSSVSWTEDTIFANNAAAAAHGGALALQNGSSASWDAPTVFYLNSAEKDGGAAVVRQSSISWTGVTTFMNNTAGVSAGVSHGGALDLWMSVASWSASTTYSGNEADFFGGAVSAGDGSSVSWTADTVFSENAAGDSGGAISAGPGSSVSWSGDTTSFFEGNRAEMFGGAIEVFEGSHISCAMEATSIFKRNSAGNGGALNAESGSSIDFGGNTSLDDNSALGDSEGASFTTGFGGGITVVDSTASWSGQVTFSGNRADFIGGAVYAWNSSLLWSGQTSLERNSAIDGGGACYVASSIALWAGNTEFFYNSANAGNGGALEIGSSTVSWGENTTFAHNRAGVSGGVFLAFEGSSVSWNGACRFHNNSAGETEIGAGGGMAVTSSEVSWTGATEFVGNSGFAGGAAQVQAGSNVSWTGDTKFVGGSVSAYGGALYVTNANISWSGKTDFFDNEALAGGALFLQNGSYVGWTSDTDFTSNRARADGGAIASPGFDTQFNPKDSTLVFSGSTTSFVNNTCEANGGGISVLGACSIEIGQASVDFIGNSAEVAGGGIFLSSAGVGPVFFDVSFISNEAQIGAGASVFGSGNAKDSNSVEWLTPTTFNGCRFIDNRATSTGGAIDTVAGRDSITNSIFKGNTAALGGALRLGGTASLENCSFVENMSDDGQGPAVSNIGSISAMTNISFSGNAFSCQPGMFLDHNTSGDMYEAVCSQCQITCEGCFFVEPLLVPICSDVLDHSMSSGGNVTVESLVIQSGYWRATASSRLVLPCLNADACLGGETGSSSFCREGYEGPYCAVCSDEYSAYLGSVCNKCSDKAGGLALAVVFGFGGLAAALAVVSYVMSGEAGGRRVRSVEGLARHIPLQSVKIVVVAWQILTQFASVANVIYPDVYQRFLDGLDVFNFNLSWVLSAGCILDTDFHDRLLIATISPIISLLFLACTFAAATRINQGPAETRQNIWNKHVSMVLLLTFLVYSSVSSVLFQTFACEKLDDGKNYLRADFRIECDSAKHKAFQVYAGLMIMFYTVGIPAFYGLLLWRDRKTLMKGAAGTDLPARVTSTSDLWKPYKPSVFYYEVVECGRRVLLAGVVVFIYPNTAAQIAVTLMISFVFVVTFEALAPYASRWDTWISRMGHAVVFVSMYVALLLKVDVADEQANSQRVFEVVLVTAHACMLLAVVAETIVVACSIRVKESDGPSPRSRDGGRVVLPSKTQTTFEEENPFAGDILPVETAPVAET